MFVLSYAYVSFDPVNLNSTCFQSDMSVQEDAPDSIPILRSFRSQDLLTKVVVVVVFVGSVCPRSMAKEGVPVLNCCYEKVMDK